MLSVFPNLFTYAMIAPLVLRLGLGGFFVLQGLRRHKEDSGSWGMLWSGMKIGSMELAPILTKIQIVIGVLLFIGLFTQVAALLAIVFVWVEWYKKSRMASVSFQELWIVVFVSVLAVALLFLGAGFIAFDLPL